MPEETLPNLLEETTPDLKLALDETALPTVSDARQIAATKLTDTLPASAYIGAATLQLTEPQEAILDEPTPDNEIDIRPDGLIYISHEFVRRQLNRVFGRLQWALVPGSPLVAEGQDLYQRWVLFVQGTYVSEAFASRRYFANGNQTRDDVAEAIKSDCLRRCCKDLGIALDAWNKRRGESWKREHAVQVLCATNRGNEKQWRRVDADPLKGEIEAKPTEVVGDKGRVADAPATAPHTHVAPPPPSTPPKPVPVTEAKSMLKPGPRAVPKPIPQTTTALKVTDAQIKLLWNRARGAGLVEKDDAEKWIEFLAENCMIPVPDRSGKKSTETAVAMMRNLPGGAYFQKLLKTLEVQAQDNPVEI